MDCFSVRLAAIEQLGIWRWSGVQWSVLQLDCQIIEQSSRPVVYRLGRFMIGIFNDFWIFGWCDFDLKLRIQKNRCLCLICFMWCCLNSTKRLLGLSGQFLGRFLGGFLGFDDEINDQRRILRRDSRLVMVLLVRTCTARSNVISEVPSTDRFSDLSKNTRGSTGFWEGVEKRRNALAVLSYWATSPSRPLMRQRCRYPGGRIWNNSVAF